MLALNDGVELITGRLAIVGKDSGKEVANGILEDDHALEVRLLKEYLRKRVHFDAVISVDGVTVGTWTT